MQRPAPGTRVQHDETHELGTVTESDEWSDTLQLRGVPPSAQVLVEWDRDLPVRLWARVIDLAVVRTPAGQ